MSTRGQGWSTGMVGPFGGQTLVVTGRGGQVWPAGTLEPSGQTVSGIGRGGQEPSAAGLDPSQQSGAGGVRSPPKLKVKPPSRLCERNRVSTSCDVPPAPPVTATSLMSGTLKKRYFTVTSILSEIA